MLIAFTGAAGSGKSTAIDTLKANSKQGVCVIKFAQPIYDIQDFAYARISSVYKKPQDFKKDRKFLQFVGTNWGRELDSEIWINLWKHRADQIMTRDLDVTVACDDARFDNEAVAVQNLGGYIVKIVRPDASTHAEGGMGIEGHASEAGISPDYIDFTVQNNGTLEEFQTALLAVIEQIRSGQAA